MQGATPVLYGLQASSDAAAGNGLSASLGSSAIEQFVSIVFDFLGSSVFHVFNVHLPTGVGAVFVALLGAIRGIWGAHT